MKRGFLLNGQPQRRRAPSDSRCTPSKPHLVSSDGEHPPSITLEAPQSITAQTASTVFARSPLSPFLEQVSGSNIHRTTRVYADNPRIVQSDFRFSQAPYFLYLPPGRNDMVFVDHLDSIQRIKTWNLWNEPPPSSSLPLPFRIQKIAGKGVGMFADRLIKAGELIMMERPLYVTRRRLTVAVDQTSANGVFYRAALSGLSEDSRTAIMALKNSYGADFDIVPGILYTNYLEVDITAEPNLSNSFVACFAILSRANHDCSPNANYFFEFRSYTGQFWATRDIAKDEEITIAYIGLLDPRARRQARLQELYMFTCACKVCSLPLRLSEKSDERREGLGAFDPYVDTLSVPSLMSKERITQALGWAGEERLTVMRARILFYGCHFLSARRDLIRAKAWVKKARKVFKMVEGEGSYNVAYMDQLNQVLESSRLHQENIDSLI